MAVGRTCNPCFRFATLDRYRSIDMQGSVADAKNRLPDGLRLSGASEYAGAAGYGGFCFCPRVPSTPQRTSARGLEESGEYSRDEFPSRLPRSPSRRPLGKLNISAEDARQAIQDMDIRIPPFTADHAFRFFELPPHHLDPFDPADHSPAVCGRYEDIPVVTSDDKFVLYKGLRLMWGSDLLILAGERARAT